MSGEWADAMAPAIQVLGWKPMIYFVAAVLIGRYLVMNLFLGVLLNAFEEEEEEEEEAADAEGEAEEAVQPSDDILFQEPP